MGWRVKQKNGKEDECIPCYIVLRNGGMWCMEVMEEVMKMNGVNHGMDGKTKEGK